MKLWPWGLLLIGLIGSAVAVGVFTLSLPGTVTVVTPGLIANPSTLAWPQATAGGSPVSIPFTLTNNGQIDLSITWTFTCSDCPTGIAGTILSSGGVTYAQNSGLTSATPNNFVSLTAQLTVAQGTPAGTYHPGFSIVGNA